MSRGSVYKTISDLQSQETEEKKIQSVVINIMTADHKNTALQVKPICITYLYGDYCNPCKSVSPKYDLLANSLTDDTCIFIKENIELGLSNNIEVIPAFQVYYLGQKIHVLYGNAIEELKEMIAGMKVKAREYDANSQFQ
jgi:thiol-disulfide isomerase/thioredoxin